MRKPQAERCAALALGCAARQRMCAMPSQIDLCERPITCSDPTVSAARALARAFRHSRLRRWRDWDAAGLRTTLWSGRSRTSSCTRTHCWLTSRYTFPQPLRCPLYSAHTPNRKPFACALPTAAVFSRSPIRTDLARRSRRTRCCARAQATSRCVRCAGGTARRGARSLSCC